jgi:hypothetical protein
MATFQFQNLNIVGLAKPLMVDNDNFIFGVMNSNEDVLHGLLKINYLYFSICMLSPKIVHCLWHGEHSRFFNFYFVMWRILEILGSQIKVGWIINIVGVLTSLWCCTPKVENLSKFFMTIKTWSIDKRAICPWEGKTIDDFLTNEANIIDENYIMLDAISYFNVHDLEWWNVDKYFTLVLETQQFRYVVVPILCNDEWIFYHGCWVMSICVLTS